MPVSTVSTFRLTAGSQPGHRGERPQIVIDASISKRYAFNAPRAVAAVKRHDFIKGGEQRVNAADAVTA